MEAVMDEIKQRALVGIVVRDDFEDSGPRIRDTDLAKRLGYERPRTIRTLIRKLLRDSAMTGVVCCAPQQTSESKKKGGRPTVEYWLDEVAAIFITTQAGTPTALAMTGEVVRFFVEVRRGEVRAASSHRLFDLQPQPWERVWEPRIVEALCALYGNRDLYVRDGRLPGKWFAQVERRIYKLVWGSDHVDEAIRRCQNPGATEQWHQHLTPEARVAFKAELNVIAESAWLFLDHARPIERFWEWMRGRYYREPVQLAIPGALLGSGAAVGRA